MDIRRELDVWQRQEAMLPPVYAAIDFDLYALICRQDGERFCWDDIKGSGEMRIEMNTIGRRLQAAAIGIAVLTQAFPAAALPMAGMVAERPSDIIKVQTTCDGRGCFTFGPRQSFTPPRFRPPDYRGPTYYRPRGAVIQPYVYRRPPVARQQPLARVPAANLDRHRQWCQKRYRSYSPVTNIYRRNGGHPVACVSPYQ